MRELLGPAIETAPGGAGLLLARLDPGIRAVEAAVRACECRNVCGWETRLSLTRVSICAWSSCVLFAVFRFVVRMGLSGKL